MKSFGKIFSHKKFEFIDPGFTLNESTLKNYLETKN